MASFGSLPQEEVFLPESFQDSYVHDYLRELIDFEKQWRHLINIHIVDFITHNQWELLDPAWRTALLPNDADNDDRWLSSLVDLAVHYKCPNDWPASLKEFIQKAKSLALPRKKLDTSMLTDAQQNVSSLDKRIRLGMTEKKIHEVEAMSALIHYVARRQSVSSVIDLGAGQGYLSRTLAILHRLRVLAVDGSEVQTCGAKRFDEHALKGSNGRSLVEHVTDMVTPENVSTLLGRYRQEEEPWLVCGLHACGDLSSLMLRLFATSSDIRCLVNVGCCYHFLSEDDGHQSPPGFPMSRFLRAYRMGSTAHMLACQTPSRWFKRKEETLKSFEHHFFRALLQHIMVEKGLASSSAAPVIGRLNKKKDFVSFPVYVQAALRRLKYPPDSISPEEAEAYYTKFKTKQVDKQIAALWTVRVLLGPVLESIILMDRWLYLKESLESGPETVTKGVWMWPLFDPITSPRNMVIVACK